MFEDDNWRIMGDLKNIYKLSDINYLKYIMKQSFIKLFKLKPNQLSKTQLLHIKLNIEII